MYYFIQPRADKKGAWELRDVKSPPDTPPAYQTVLALSADPSSYEDQGLDPDDKIKYLGPMYFDLDGSDLDAVLDDTRSILHRLVWEFSVPEEAISTYLSGSKGVHITVDPQVFGVTKPTLMLPLIWKKFAEKFEFDSVDMVVYSMGKGRMWRQCGIRRPDKGTYKVEVSRDEILHMDADKYAELVAKPRPEFGKNRTFKEIPELSSFVRAASDQVKHELRNYKKYLNSITSEDLRQVEGIPGCIQTLVKDGDCPASNWNQAAMQLAGYVAARYEVEESDEYEPLLDEFLANVTSSSRPSESERRSALTALLKRAWRGAIKFSAGGIIKTIGHSCGSCVVCSRKQALAEAKDDGYYDKATGIKITKDAVFLVGEQSMKSILTCGVKQETNFVRIDEFGQQLSESGVYVFSGGTVLDGEMRAELTEEMFIDRRKLNVKLAGAGAIFEGTDADLLKLYRVMHIKRREAAKMIRTPLSGIQFHERGGDLYPNLVTRTDSFRKGNTPSEFVYCGNPNLAPDFTNVRDFETQEDVDNLVAALGNLIGMNEEHIMLACIGWVCATHLKSHFTYKMKGFPALNLNGSSHNGKSATAYLLLTLNGFPYQAGTTWNAETSTLFPLEEMVCTSTTFVRLIEEANEHSAKSKWEKLMGMIKGAWDESGINRGTLSGKEVASIRKRNPAPLMILSEQSLNVQSVRTRTLEYTLTTRARENPTYIAKHEAAIDLVEYLEMFAKVLVTTALNTSIAQVEEWKHEVSDLIPKVHTGRVKTAYQAVFCGLKFLKTAIEAYSEEFAAEVEKKIDRYAHYLENSSKDTNRSKKLSALDEVIASFDQMASESDNPNHGLRAGTHYWKDRSTVYLDIRTIFPRYRRYSRGIGAESSLTNLVQILNLLKGETYYKGEVTHPSVPTTHLYMLDLDKLHERGIHFSYLDEEHLD